MYQVGRYIFNNVHRNNITDNDSPYKYQSKLIISGNTYFRKIQDKSQTVKNETKWALYENERENSQKGINLKIYKYLTLN